jgi:hypothetical protein
MEGEKEAAAAGLWNWKPFDGGQVREMDKVITTHAHTHTH